MSAFARCPALLIAAPASGQGKTTVTAALARLYTRKGLKVRVFKCGPDFLDPHWHELASGAPVHSLDLWINGAPDCAQRLHDAAREADLILIEGVMGLFDGAPSAADLAQRFGVPVLAVNAKDRDSVASLEPWLGEGQSIVLVGSSGAGKSTLTNTLLGTERMKTGAVRESDARGRHTTTHRALIALPSGACMIDTPGMRELKPTGEEVVAESFADIEALAAACKFNDCRHLKEPGCAVRAAIEAGEVDAQRVANFLKLSAEVAGAANQLATRLAQKADAKVQNKALYKRVDEKYGRH